MRNLLRKVYFGLASAVAGTIFMAVPAFADSVTVNFEPSTYSLGNINGQDGWMKTGAFDVAVVSNTYGFGALGSQSLRISDAVTSGSFGDQTFAKPLADAVGEADSTDGTFSRGTLQSRFEMQFDLASALPTLQTGMHISVSPDRGDGSRMSYLRFEDQADGIHVFFDDVTDAGPLGTVASFNETDVATVSRSPHTIKLTMDMVNGPANDVVKVYLDGALVHTGTSWEDYYRYDPEANAEQSPRIIKTVLFRESGTANSSNSGNGFLVDNLSLLSGPTPPVLVGPPTNKNQCKKDGWKVFNNPTFRNQGQCVKFVEAHKDDDHHDGHHDGDNDDRHDGRHGNGHHESHSKGHGHNGHGIDD